MSKISKVVLAVPVSLFLLVGVSACAPSEQVSSPSETVAEGSQTPDSAVPYSVTGDELAEVLQGYLSGALTSVEDPAGFLENLESVVKDALGEDRYAEVAPESDPNGVSFIQMDKMTSEEIQAVIEAVEGIDELKEYVSFEGLDDKETLSLHIVNILAMYGGGVGSAMEDISGEELIVEISGDKLEISDDGKVFVDKEDIVLSLGDQTSESGTGATFYVDQTGIKLSGRELIEDSNIDGV